MKGASVILRRLGNSRPSSFMPARSSLLSSSRNETLMLSSAAAAASLSTLVLSDEWRRLLFNSVVAPTVSAISPSTLRFDNPRSLSTHASSGRLISPIIGQLSVKYPHVHTYKIDIDKDLRGGILVPVQGMPSPLFAIEINPEKTKEDFRSAIQKDGGAGVKSFMDSMGLEMFSQQCMRGVALVPLEGAQSSLFPLEINSEKMKENFQSAIQRNYDSDVKDFMDGMGLGLLSQQLEELELGELLVTPPLGLDKATAISKACYTAPRSSIDAVYQPLKIQRSSSKIIQCGPKKIKFAKQRRGRMKGIAHRGNHICFGRYALQALEPGWITSKQLESGRRALARNLGRGIKIWVRVFPDKPVTAKPAETRMGRGKGNVQFWVAVVQPGRILYEMGGISESIARKAISVAASKLPIRTRFIALE